MAVPACMCYVLPVGLVTSAREVPASVIKGVVGHVTITARDPRSFLFCNRSGLAGNGIAPNPQLAQVAAVLLFRENSFFIKNASSKYS